MLEAEQRTWAWPPPICAERSSGLSRCVLTSLLGECEPPSSYSDDDGDESATLLCRWCKEASSTWMCGPALAASDPGEACELATGDGDLNWWCLTMIGPLDAWCDDGCCEPFFGRYAEFPVIMP